MSAGTCWLVGIFLEILGSEGALTPATPAQIIDAIGLIMDGIKNMDKATVVEYC